MCRSTLKVMFANPHLMGEGRGYGSIFQTRMPFWLFTQLIQNYYVSGMYTLYKYIYAYIYNVCRQQCMGICVYGDINTQITQCMYLYMYVSMYVDMYGYML